MITPKKKIIYFVLIGVSVIGSLLVFKFGMNTPGSTPTVDFGNIQNNVANQTEQPTQTQGKITDLTTPEFPQAVTFPLKEKFNQSVLESSAYKNLKKYDLLTIDKNKELGKQNPFVSE